VQRLYHYEEHPILTVALVPAVGDWAVTMEKAGAVGHLTTPLSPESVSRLAAMLPPAVRDAYAYRTSDKYIPRLSPEVAQIVDQGGWRRQTVAFWAPSGGVGKTTLSVNVAAALGVIANKRTLLIDTDMNKGDAHLLLNLEGEDGRGCAGQATGHLWKRDTVGREEIPDPVQAEQPVGADRHSPDVDGLRRQPGGRARYALDQEAAGTDRTGLRLHRV